MKANKMAINWFIDFDKEEKWINDMAKSGWALWHTNGVIYRFKKCEPNEFIYQINISTIISCSVTFPASSVTLNW